MNKRQPEDILRQHNIKLTKQRILVLHVLLTKSFPISAEDIYKELIEKEKNLNLSTVYRILEVLSQNGIVEKHKLSFEDKMSFELSSPEHKHHLVCTKCKKVVPIKGCPIDAYAKKVADKTKFKIIEHNLEIVGICPECNKKE